MDEVAQALGISLPCNKFDTFNGLVFGALAVIPLDGDTVEVETCGLAIHVTSIRGHQVESALVHRKEAPQTEPAETLS